MLGLTAAFLLVSAGYFAGTRSGAEPYRVEAELPLPTAESAPMLPPPTGTAQPEFVNINTATEAELAALPGIGEKRAADIVADRAANGPFRYPEDITRVKGIGEGTLAGLLDYITTA